MRRYLHVTDVGAATGDGSDSTVRILKSYNRLGVNADVVTAGSGPLRVAFVGITDLQDQAFLNIENLYKKIGFSFTRKNDPIALNCAPRDSVDKKPNAAEDYIYRVATQNEPDVLLYGPKVLEYVLYFRGRANTQIDKIFAVRDVIEDTSKGSQFRSAQYLPIVHYLQGEKMLDDLADKEAVNLDDVNPIALKAREYLILPPDEFKNGRILVSRQTYDEIKNRDSIGINEANNAYICSSLTDVTPGEIAIWQSSNHFPNKDLVVLNIGTRWANGKTKIEDPQILGVVNSFAENVGTTSEFSF